MRLDQGVIKLFCLPILCAFAMIVVGSSATFASTRQQAIASTICPTLKYHSHDSSPDNLVSLLQIKLKNAGEDLGTTGVAGNGIDGDFGPVTQQAVMSYQRTHNDTQGQPLTVDGRVGPLTWGALGGCDASTAPPHQDPSTQPAGSTNTVTVNVSNPDTASPNGTNAQGSGTFTFSGPTQITNITLTVTDTYCNHNPVDIQIRIYDSLGAHDERVLKNTESCTTTTPQTSGNMSYTNRASGAKGATGGPLRINGARIRVCNEGFFTTSCTQSNYFPNPN
jgi:peptidoglycan hydrolase-like protein with peptidoglycan-binding domain